MGNYAQDCIHADEATSFLVNYVNVRLVRVPSCGVPGPYGWWFVFLFLFFSFPTGTIAAYLQGVTMDFYLLSFIFHV